MEEKKIGRSAVCPGNAVHQSGNASWSGMPTHHRVTRARTLTHRFTPRGQRKPENPGGNPNTPWENMRKLDLTRHQIRNRLLLLLLLLLSLKTRLVKGAWTPQIAAIHIAHINKAQIERFFCCFTYE